MQILFCPSQVVVAFISPLSIHFVMWQKKLANVHNFSTLSPSTSSPLIYCNRNKIAVMLYLPHYANDYYLMQFVTFVYASWRFITENAADYVDIPDCSSIDLVVFCESTSCQKLPKDCSEFLSNYTTTSKWSPQCFFHEEHVFKHPYQNMLNSFSFAKDQHFQESILDRYDHLLRTDIDVFLRYIKIFQNHYKYYSCFLSYFLVLKKMKYEKVIYRSAHKYAA